MTPEEGAYDAATEGFVVRVTEHWIVSVHPMLVNHRIKLTRREDYPFYVSAGWCYDEHYVALAAAVAYDPEVDRAPVGWKKIAVDERHSLQGCRSCSRQDYDERPACGETWCPGERRPVEDVHLPE